MRKRKGVISFYLVLSLFLLSSIVYAEDLKSARSTNTWDSENAGTHFFFVLNSDIAVTEIWFDSTDSFNNAKMIIESSDSLPAISTLSNVYQYETIGKFGIDDKIITNFKVKYRVKKSWILENSNNDTINLYYYDNSWKKSSSKYIFSDAIYSYYESSPEKISYLAISGDKKRETIISAPVEQISKGINTLVNTTSDLTEKIGSTSIGFLDKLFGKNKNLFLYSLIIIGIAIPLLILVSFFNIMIKGDYYENVKDAEAFIDEELAEGVSKKEIEKTLEDKGWPKRVVEKLVHNHHLTPDMEIKLKSSIQNMKSNFMSDNEIKKSLVKNGWAQDLVDDIMEEFTA